MRASDVLRERANDRVGVDPHELRALADLLDACVTKSAGYFRCEICGAQASSGVYSECRAHMGDCALIAVERAFKGESDAEGK